MCSCKNGCKKCKAINGISYTIAIASADSADGSSGFTFPANNAQAYIGFASVLANNFTPTLANSNWVWIPIPQALAYADSHGSVSLDNTLKDIITIASVPAGTYLMNFSDTVVCGATEVQNIVYEIWNDTDSAVIVGSVKGNADAFMYETDNLTLITKKITLSGTKTIKVRIQLFTGTVANVTNGALQIIAVKP